MHIKIIEDGRRYSFFIPNAFLTSRWAYKALVNNSSKMTEKQKEQTNRAVDLTFEVFGQFAKELKRWRRENGKLTLVEVRSAEGEEVTITI
jgi:hypothetical protein